MNVEIGAEATLFPEKEYINGIAVAVHHTLFYISSVPMWLKVLTNEKRGGLKVVAFDRFPFKLFTRRFSNKSVQAPSSERPKTTQRTLFLSFEINNCLQITA
jgi:hypothetical protein